MKYWQIVYYTGEDNYETKEMFITDEQYKQVQEVIRNGEDFLVIEGKPTIKRKHIASINDADKIIAEHEQSGTLNLIFPKAGDLPEPTPEVQEEEKKRRQESKKRGLRNLDEWVKKQPWYQKHK